MIPCKECLILAICRTKNRIKCSLLYKWIDDVEDYSEKDTEECFPSLMYFHRSTKDIVSLHYYDKQEN